jgi:hypothetical protein
VAIGQGALISWKNATNPGFDGGVAMTNFTIVASPGGQRWTSPIGVATSVTVQKLLVNVTYTFTVIANNINGPSQPSADSNPVVPFANVPDPPTNVVASAGPQQATVTWNAPVEDGGVPITSYEIDSNSSITVNISVNATSPLTVVVPHLWDVSPPYTFTVRAANSAGQGLFSGPSVAIKVQPNRPDPPVNVKVKASFSGADVSFTAPANDGGAKITSYIAISDPPTSNYTNSESPISFKDLDSKKNYTFIVFAMNSQGTSDGSLPSESFRRSSQILKDLAVPIAGGIILGLLLIVGIIIGLLVCRNTEKCCWAREGGSTTSDKPKDVTTATTAVDLEEHPKTEPIPLGQSSSGYVDTQTQTKEPDQQQEV